MKYVKLYVRCVTRHKKYSIVTTFEKKNVSGSASKLI